MYEAGGLLQAFAGRRLAILVLGRSKIFQKLPSHPIHGLGSSRPRTSSRPVKALYEVQILKLNRKNKFYKNHEPLKAFKYYVTYGGYHEMPQKACER